VLRTPTILPTFRTFVAINRHFVLHVGRVEKSRLHLDASIGGGRRFDTVIMIFWYLFSISMIAYYHFSVNGMRGEISSRIGGKIGTKSYGLFFLKKYATILSMKYKTALITGASRGIGRAIALEYARLGLDLILTCRERQDALLAVKESCEAEGVQVHPFVGDLSSPETIHTLFEELALLKIQPDVLVNNAGVSRIGLVQDISPEEWFRISDINLSAPFLLAGRVIPGMLQKGCGRILNISSVWGNAGASCEAAYSATKGGLNAMTKALARELAPSGIQVNAIACGAIDTEMNSHLSSEELAALADGIPAGRLGTAEEAAALAGLLLQAPDYLTGQIITMDGGWT